MTNTTKSDRPVMSISAMNCEMDTPRVKVVAFLKQVRTRGGRFNRR